MPRSLLPREHGAYAQLAAPLVAAFATFGVTVAAGVLALGACLAFVANEPLLVVLGHRGKRMQASDGPRAKRMLAVLVPLAVVAGVAGLALAPAAWLPAAILTVPALVLVGFAYKRAERSLAGELVAAIALTGAGFPVAVAAGAPVRDAAVIWAGWAIGYAFTVVAVHRVIARHRRSASAADAVAGAAAVVAIGLLVASHVFLAVPLVAGALVLLVIAPSATYLRPIGFALVGASIVSIVLVAAVA